MSNHLIPFLEQKIRPRILLLGDVMLDRYAFGDVERISPEAPIPVLRVGKREHRLGGAGSVATMLSALDARVVLAGVTGEDHEASLVRRLLEKIDVDCRCLLTDSQRPTTLKERLLGRSHQRHPHHMMRVDRESTEPIDAELAEQLLAGVRQCLDRIELIIISDYNKGVCAGDMIPRLVQLARSAGVGVLADPVCDADYRRYAGCTCITPNRTEAGRAVGRKIETPQDGVEAARQLLGFGIDTVLVTLDRDGIAMADRGHNARLFSGRPCQVSDVTGAGDMVISAVGYCLAAGAEMATAVEIANLAGGMEVRRLGVVPLARRELLAELSDQGAAAENKTVSVEQLEGRLERLRQGGRRIVMTNGCYDLLHPGHVACLQEARKQGDCLVVGLNSDRSVRELKGPGRPLVDQQGRAAMLAALECVDYVVIFDEVSVAPLVRRLLPDVLVKASQYSLEEVVGHEIVLGSGGHVVTVPMNGDYSTSKLIEKVQLLSDDKRAAA